MSWNGTLRCTYCYQNGHSRRKCPEMKKRHDDWASATEEERQNMTWHYRDAYREYKQHQEGLKESNKQCSYCYETGHRVLTCPTRLRNVDTLKSINRWWKPLVTKTLSDIGFGLGTLIERECWVTVNNEEVRRSVPFMVVGADPHSFDFTSVSEGFGQIHVMNTITMNRHRFDLPRFVVGKLYANAFTVEGYEWRRDRWREDDTVNPFQQHIRRHNAVFDAGRVLSPSDRGFSEELFFPLEKKKDINKMFRPFKKSSDRNRFYTDQHVGRWVETMHEKLQKHGVCK